MRQYDFMFGGFKVLQEKHCGLCKDEEQTIEYDSIIDIVNPATNEHLVKGVDYEETESGIIYLKDFSGVNLIILKK